MYNYGDRKMDLKFLERDISGLEIKLGTLIFISKNVKKYLQ